MTTHSFIGPRPRAGRKRRWSQRMLWGARSHSRPRRCPVCRTRVRADDALGLVGSRIAHAECALVQWLESDDV